MSVEPIQVALASYDPRELRVQRRYLEEQPLLLSCICYQSGWALLDALRLPGSVQVILLGSQLEDMDAQQFVERLRELERKPLLLLTGVGRSRINSLDHLHMGENYYMMRELEHVYREIERLCGPAVPGGLETACRRLFAAWGVQCRGDRCDYLVAALYIACAGQQRLAIRKELLDAVACKYGVTVSAVDSGIRRLIDELEAHQTEAWQNFKRDAGLGAGRPTPSRLIYGLRDLLLERAGAC